MGNKGSRDRQQQFNPSTNGWEVKEKGEEFNVWRHQQTGEEIEEYRRVFSDQRHFEHEREMFSYRLDSDILVASRYFKEQSQRDMCSTFYKGSIYLERIPVRLSQINEIPFPDVLHLYHQAFRGFAKLFDKVGYFEPTESLIGVNQQGIVKIWLNENLAKSYPETLFGDDDRSEGNMVIRVVNIIHANTDGPTQPENILDTMRRNSVSTFRQADNVLQELATRHGQTIPNQLDCVLEMRPQLLSRLSGEPVATVVPGLATQQPISISNVQGVQVGTHPSNLLLQTATFPQTLNRTAPVPFNRPPIQQGPPVQQGPRYNQNVVLQQPRQSFTLPAKPATSISVGQQRVAFPQSVSQLPVSLSKPHTALVSNRSAQGAVRSNPSSRASIVPPSGRTVPLATIPEQQYRVAPQVRPRNTLPYAPAVRTARGNTFPGQVQINLANPKPSSFATTTITPTIPLATVAATTTTTASGRPTIHEVEKRTKDTTQYTSPEILKMLGLKSVEEKTGRFDYDVYTKKEETTTITPIVQPITHTDYNSEDYISSLNERYNYTSYEPTTTIAYTTTLPKYEPTYATTAVYTETKPVSVPKIEFTYSSSLIPRTETIYGNVISSAPVTVQPSTFAATTTTTTFETTETSYPTATASVYDATKYSALETQVVDYQIGSISNKYDYDYKPTFSGTRAGYSSYKSEYSPDVLPAESRLAATMVTNGLTSSPIKLKQTTVYEGKYSEYEEIKIEHTSTNFKSTDEIYKVTESFMASGNYTPAITSTTTPLSVSSYNYTNTLPSASLSNFGSFATTSYTPALDFASYSAAPVTRQESSYNVSMDNELLRDLEKMRTGTLTKPSAAVTTTTTTNVTSGGEFISTLSFGANSHYVRDSIRSGLSQ